MNGMVRRRRKQELAKGGFAHPNQPFRHNNCIQILTYPQPVPPYLYRQVMIYNQNFKHELSMQ